MFGPEKAASNVLEQVKTARTALSLPATVSVGSGGGTGGWCEYRRSLRKSYSSVAGHTG